MEEFFKAHDQIHQARQQDIPAAFPEEDPRRFLMDTILGFPAAMLIDVSRRLGTADPFSRLARRLSLWFKPLYDHSRYGLPAANGRAVADLVHRLGASSRSYDSANIQRLLAIWSGEINLKADKESVDDILELLFPSQRADVGGLDGVLGLEILGALANDIDALNVETAKSIFEGMKSIHSGLDDGRPATAVFRTWLSGWSQRGERFRLAYDPSEAFSWSVYSRLNGNALEPLLTATLNDLSEGGHSIFARSPLPLGGDLFGRERPLFQALSKQAPEAADLYLLFSADGDYADFDGPLPTTGDGIRHPNFISTLRSVANG